MSDTVRGARPVARDDSPGRRLARRVLRNATMGVGGRTKDLEYAKLVDRYRPAGGREPRKQ